MMLATLLLCVGPGLISIHGNCYSYYSHTPLFYEGLSYSGEKCYPSPGESCAISYICIHKKCFSARITEKLDGKWVTRNVTHPSLHTATTSVRTLARDDIDMSYSPACLQDRMYRLDGPNHNICTYIVKNCAVTLQFDKAKGFPTKTREVLHDDGACIRPYAFLLGGTGNLMEIRDESALTPPILEEK